MKGAKFVTMQGFLLHSLKQRLRLPRGAVVASESQRKVTEGMAKLPCTDAAVDLGNPEPKLRLFSFACIMQFKSLVNFQVGFHS